MTLRLTFLAAIGALAAAASPALAYTTDFSSVNGKSTPLTIQAFPGVKATFASPSGKGTFLAGPTGGLFSFSNGLGDYDSFSGDTLTISFSKAINAVSFIFGVEDAFATAGADTLVVTANTGQTATFATKPDGLTLGDPEGAAYFTGAPFTSLSIADVEGGAADANPFAISAFTVPEPVSLSLFGAGLAGLSLARRRRG